jgi:hypothetical protein
MTKYYYRFIAKRGLYIKKISLSCVHLLLFLMTFICSSIHLSQAGEIERFTGEIIKKCPSSNPLAVKKSMFEIIQGSEDACNRPFTSRLLMTCQNLSCQHLISEYKKTTQQFQGTVIGQ